MLKPGHILGKRYKIIKPLGQGGQSNIYLIEDTRLKGKKWAAKEMVAQYTDPRDQAKAKVHFEREAQLLATLEHPNLPKVTDFFTEKGKHYLIMEYVQGKDLGRTLQKNKKPFSEQETANWAIQVAKVLYYLHRQNPPIIFRDIKPSNIMVSRGIVKLIDFGIARHFNPAKKGDTLRIGSPGYSPPEQYSGQTDPRSDIYSLGVAMHHLLTNIDPSQSQTPFALPPIKAYNKNVSSKMVSIVEKATQIDPQKRYQTALDLKKDLNEIVKPTGLTQLTPPPVGALTTPQPPGGFTVPQAPPKVAIPQSALTNVVPPQVTRIAPISKNLEGGEAPLNSKMPPSPEVGQAPPLKGYSIINKIGIILMLIILGGGLYLYHAISTGKIKIPGTIVSSPSPVATGIFKGGTPLEKGLLYYNAGKYRKSLMELLKARHDDSKSPFILINLNNALIKAAGGKYVNITVLLSHKIDLSKDPFLSGIALGQRKINFQGGVKGRGVIINVKKMGENQKKNKALAESIFADNPLAVIVGGDIKYIDTIEKESNFRKILLFRVDSSSELKNVSSLFFNINSVNEGKALIEATKIIKIPSTVLVYNKDNESILKLQNFLGTEIVGTYLYEPDNLDFNKIVQDIKSSKAQSIIFLGNSISFKYFFKSILKRGVDKKIFVSASIVRKELNPSLIAITPLYYWAANYPAANFMSFYKETYSNDSATLLSAYGYELLQIIAYSADRSSFRGEKINEFIFKDNGLSRYKGVLGTLLIQKNKKKFIGLFIPKWWGILQVASGKWQQRGGFEIK